MSSLISCPLTLHFPLSQCESFWLASPSIFFIHCLSLNGSFDCYCVVLFVAIRGPLIRLPVLIYSDWFPFLLVLFVCPKKEEEKKLMPVVSKDILLLTCYILGSCILYTEFVHFSK